MNAAAIAFHIMNQERERREREARHRREREAEEVRRKKSREQNGSRYR